jgi:hypothetical protein
MNPKDPLNWRHALISLFIALICMAGYATYTEMWTDWFPSHDYPEETLPEVHAINFYSHQINDHYNLYVQLPHGYDESNKKYPVIYATDGGAGNAFYKETILPMLRRNQIPQMIFVGIANATRGITVSIGGTDPLRLRDFTYSSPSTPLNQQGNENLHRFIEENIKPFINATYKTKPEESGLGGHSLGGLFTLYALFRHPESYKYYFASSPTLFWNKSRIFEEEKVFYSKRDPLPVSLYMSAAERESPILLDHYDQMKRILKARDYQGFRFKTEVIPNETHGSVVSESIPRGLRFLYKK